MCQDFLQNMNKQKYQELKDLSGESQQIHDSLIQAMDNSGKIGERCLGIRCVAEKQKEQE